MSKKRQMDNFSPAGIRTWDVVTLTRDYPSGHVTPRHSHLRDQLVFASSGVMTVRSSDGVWVVPPQRAVWIPAGISHRVLMSGHVAMRTLYFRPRLAPSLPRHCGVVNVPPLLRELILHACAREKLRRRNERDRNLVHVVLDQLHTIRTVPLQLPNLRDARAARCRPVAVASGRGPLPGCALRANRRQQAHHRALVPQRCAAQLWKVASAIAANARHAVAGQWSSSHPGCSGCGLQYA